MVRGLDDDEVEFLETVDRNRMELEKKQRLEEFKELEEFRQRSAAPAVDLKEKLSADLNGGIKPKQQISSNRPSQKSILSGVIKKRPSEVGSNESTSKKPKITAAVPIAILPQATEATKNSLNCVGILPGIGCYRDTSDSDDSSDPDIDTGLYDFCGRKLVKKQTDCSQE